jgi:SAM-dependent methyltransferase
MPKSKAWGKAWVDEIYAHLFAAGRVSRVLDVGVGRGTYSMRLREAHPGVEWVGVEVWEPYVGRFDLAAKYDELLVEDVRTLDWSALGRFDVAFMGDVLEHMHGTEAIELVGRTLSAGAIAFVSIPIYYLPQGPVEGNPYEEHLKADWSHEEIMLSLPMVRASYRHGFLGVYACAPPGGPTEALKAAVDAVPASAIGGGARVDWEGERARPGRWRATLAARRARRLVLGRAEDRHTRALQALARKLGRTT